jgi:hypothetical protein
MLPYLNRIIPSLFNLIKEVTSNELPDADGDKKELNTYDVDEAEIAIAMLEVFIEKFDTNFEPFAKQATQVNII